MLDLLYNIQPFLRIEVIVVKNVRVFRICTRILRVALKNIIYYLVQNYTRRHTGCVFYGFFFFFFAAVVYILVATGHFKRV